MKFEASTSLSDKDTFLISKNKKVNYKEANERIGKAANWLNNRGISAGQKVALSLTNEWDTATLFLACLKLGVTTVLIDPRFKKSKQEATITRVSPDLIIADQVQKPALEQTGRTVIGLSEAVKKSAISKLLGKKKPAKTADNSLEGLLAELEVLNKFPEVDESATAYILFTSGSSAQPKGVKISFKNLLAHLATLKAVYELSSQSHILNILPIYHTDGIIQGPILTYYTGCTLVRPFDFEISKVQELFDSIYKYRISHFLTVPTMIDILVKFSAGYEDSFKTPDFKHIISSASILEKEVWNAFETKFDVAITNVFGLTETVAGGLFCGPDEATKRIGSIGKPIDCEVKLLNEAGEEISTSNEVGELYMRGEHIAEEYLDMGAICDTEGWFATGDLAYRDCDDFYYIHGRKSNVIISGGVNISPEEIQEVINASDLISESYVFGIKDATWGEKVATALVPAVDETAFNLDQLKSHLNEHLEPNKIPTSYQFVAAIPKTLSGKLDKQALLEMLDNDQANGQGKDIKENIVQLAASAFNLSAAEVDIYAHSKSVDGWTSLNHLDFIVKMEKAYEIKFSTAEIMTIATVNDAIELATQKLA